MGDFQQAAVFYPPDDAFQETSARYRAVAPEQWLQRQPEAGSSWPSWLKASHDVWGICFQVRENARLLFLIYSEDQWEHPPSLS